MLHERVWKNRLMLTYKVSGQSHVGCVRRANEDYIGWRVSTDGRRALAVLADGMGGHAGGAEASRIAVEAFIECAIDLMWRNVELSEYLIRERLLDAAEAANEAVCVERRLNEALSGMGTTLVAAFSYDGEACVVHAGDSRCYLVSQSGELRQLTRDDSVVQQMLDDGSITEQDAPHVPYRNMLTKALGCQEDLLFSCINVSLKEGERLLLCSDGLFNMLPHGVIGDLASGVRPQEERVDSLIAATLNKGAEDNVSVLMVEVSGVAIDA
ncbi:serine/threonine-protein phosphatase [Hahella sp. KA22]|nr:serine/threonine-protein phosphatase [Hahella sp. KA22]QAY56926.1 serine/threonine-protein phosphatase [Hahella sp. KA22]